MQLLFFSTFYFPCYSESFFFSDTLRMLNSQPLLCFIMTVACFKIIYNTTLLCHCSQLSDLSQSQGMNGFVKWHFDITTERSIVFCLDFTYWLVFITDENNRDQTCPASYDVHIGVYSTSSSIRQGIIIISIMTNVLCTHSLPRGSVAFRHF